MPVDYTVGAYRTLCDQGNLSKISAIKEVRDATGLSLAMAKNAVDSAEKFGSVTVYQRCRHSVTRTTVATMASHNDTTPGAISETFHVYASDERIS